jgi:hypothetical protein
VQDRKSATFRAQNFRPLPIVEGRCAANPRIAGKSVWRLRDAEHAVLYRVIDAHLEAFLETAKRHADGPPLPEFVEQELRDFLTCGLLAHGFARQRVLSLPIVFAICWRGTTRWRARRSACSCWCCWASSATARACTGHAYFVDAGWS